MIQKLIQKNNLKVLILLSIIIFGGTALRLWRLTSLPLPPNGDELAFGYYGWTLLHFGTDEYANRFPIYFPSIGDYKHPVLSYINMIPMALFGLSDYAVRFWSSLSGILLIVLIFIISFLIFNKPLVALFSALFIAVSPWNITLSRVGYDSNIGNLLSVGAITTIILAMKVQEGKINLGSGFYKLTPKKLFIAGFLLFFISAFSYGSQKIFIPSFLLLFLCLLLVTKTRLMKIVKYLVIIFLILTFVISVSLIPWQSRGRASGVVWKFPQDKIEKDIYYDGISQVRTPLFVTRTYHNKITALILETGKRYIDHFSPSFLFFEGDRSPETTPDVGILLHIEIIFLLTGMFSILNIKKNNYKLIVFSWLLSGPIASSITSGGPHLVRASITFPSMAIFSGYGLFTIILALKNIKTGKLFTLFLLFLILLNVFFIVHQIFIHKPVQEPWHSDQGKKELISEVLSRKNNYAAVAMKDDPYIFFLFYGKITPSEFIQNSEILPESRETQWDRVNRYSNIFFKMPFDCPKGGKLNVLYVCKGSEVPQNAKVLKVIYFSDGIPAYSLIEFFPFSEAPRKPEPLPSMFKYMVEKETKYPDGIIPDGYPSLW